METSIWEKVLIDWVNCLKLSKPIQKLQDLRDGIFFCNLQKVIKKSTHIEQDLITCLFHMLNQHYPKFIIRNISNIHISDMNNEELFYITSLLMHYTCIHDRRDVLTSPLCHNLQQTTQICIKSFLEKVQEYSELTNETLHKIITSCEEEMETFSSKQSVQWLSSPAEFTTAESPLQNILKTPSTKLSRLIEKDREIVRLKTDLEIMQEEKDNLEEDLRMQIERNKKLESHLKQKTLEITSLRSEVLALEGRTPPHYQDKDFRETQKILRTKVESLEKIMEQCDAENQELLQQRDADRTQIKLLESQCKTWLEKFLEADNKLQILTEHSKEQESKLRHLQNHCNELETLLGELQHKSNSNESFTEESFHSTNINRRSKTFVSSPSCEDLAQSVVDVQLREKQKENEEIRRILSDTEDALKSVCKENKDLQTDMTNLLTEHTETTDKLNKCLMVNEDLSQENKLLMEKINIMSSEIVDLVKKNGDIEEQLSFITDKKNSIQKMLEATEEEHKNILEQLRNISKENSILTDQISNLNEITRQLREEKIQINQHISELICMKQHLNDEYEKITKEKHILQTEISALDNKLKQVMQQKDNLLVELEILRHENSSMASQLLEINNNYKQLCEEKLVQNQQFEEEKTRLTKNFESFSLQKVEEIRQVVEESSKKVNEISKLNSKLQDLTLQKEHFEEKLNKINVEKAKENQKLRCDNLVLTDQISDVNDKFNKIMEEKNALEREISEVSDKLKEVMQQKDHLLEELEIMKKENSSMASQLSNLNNYKQLYEEILVQNQQFEEENARLTKNFESFSLQKTEEIRKLVEETNTKENELSKLNSKFEELMLQKEYIEEESNKINVEKAKENQKLRCDNLVLTDQIADLKDEFNKIIEEKHVMKTEISALSDKLKGVMQQKDHLLEQLEIMKNENSSLASQLSNRNKNYKQLCEERLVQNQQFEEEKASLTKNFESFSLQKTEEIRNLVEETNIKENELSKLNSKLQELMLQKEYVEEELNKINVEKAKENQKWRCDNLVLTDQISDLKDEFIKIMEEKHVMKTEISTLFDKLKEVMQQKEHLLEQLEIMENENSSMTSHLLDLNNYYKQLCDERLVQNQQFEEEKASLTKNFETFALQKTEEIRKLVEETNIKENELSKLNSKLQELMLQKEYVEEELNKISVQKAKENQKLRCDNLVLTDQISDLKDEFNKIVEEKHTMQTEISALDNKLKQVMQQEDHLLKQLDIMKKENSSMTCQLLDLNRNCKQLYEEKLSQNQEFEVEKASLTKKIDSLLLQKTDEIRKLIEEKYKKEEDFSKLNRDMQDFLLQRDLVEGELNFIKIEEVKENQNQQFEGDISELLCELEEEKMNLTDKMNSFLSKENDQIIKKEIFLESNTSDSNKLSEIVIKEKEMLEKNFEKYRAEKESQIVQLSAEKFELIQQISDLNNRITQFQAQKMNQQFEVQVLNLTSEIKQRKEETLNLMHFSQEKIEDSEQYKLKQISDLTCKIIQLKEETTNLECQFHSFYQEKSKDIDQIMEDKINREADDTTELTSKLQEILKQKDVLQEKLDEILLEKANEIEKLIYHISNLNNVLKDVQQKQIREHQQCEVQVSLLNKDIMKVKENNERLNENLQSVLHEKNENIEKLFKEKNNMEAKIVELNNKLQAISEQNDSLQPDMNVEFLKADAIQVQCFEECKIEKERLASEKYILSKENSTLNEKIQLLMEKNETLEKHFREIELRNSCIESERTTILKSINELEQEKKVVSNFLYLNNSELQKVIEEKDKILEALVMSNKEVENVNMEKKQLLVQISNISESYGLASKELENLKEENQTLKFKNSELVIEKEKLLETEHEMKISLQTLKKENEDLLLEVSKKSRCIQNITNDIENLYKEKDDLKNQLAELELTLKKITDEKAFLISDNFEKLLQEKAEFSEQLDKVSQEKADISEKLQCILKQSVEVADLMRKTEQLSEENAQLLGKVTILSNDLEAKTKQVSILELSNKQMKKSIDEKSELLQKVSIENNDVFEIVDRLSQEKSDMAQSLEVALRELEKRSEEKSQLEHNLHELSDQYENLDKENVSLRESLEMSHKELQKVKRERNELLQTQTKIMKETENNILLAHESAVEVRKDLMKRIELVESDKQNIKTQYDTELKKLRDAYAQVVSTNSRSEMEKMNLRRKIEEKNQQLLEYSQIKEAYEKLLEENNKLMTEVDTIKYKRSRDREEFVNLLKREREEADARENKKVREVRNEYEDKLEKMKEKMLKLYREEVNKEMQKVKAGQSESNFLQKTIEELRRQLFETEQKIHLLETELDMKKISEAHSKEFAVSVRHNENHYSSVRDSICSVRSVGYEVDMKYRPSSTLLPRRVQSITSVNTYEDREINIGSVRKMVTLPRGHVKEIEESNRITPDIGNLEMEDEDDDFNNKYLADLKAGRCLTNDTGRDSNINRFSELAWRNSMVPPHLKSSYPAEMQFVSPTRFKEEEIKSGNVELDDSLSRLLPNEKHRQKKDFGTTSYKKPGPPTPSKNGGRLSLQGNEIQPLREQNQRMTITPKKVTPSRIKALFMGRTNVARENTENQCTTPKGSNKRLSIFKKQK